MADRGFIAIPLKKAEPVAFQEPLAKFISREYNADPAEYSAAVSTLSSLRDTCVVGTPQIHESGLNALSRYYGLFLSMLKRFPFVTEEAFSTNTPSPIRMNFAWHQVFPPSGLFAKSSRIEIANAHYEKVCVLFNIAALQTQIGCTQNFESADGLIMAAKCFQNAAIIFKNLITVVQTHFKTPPSPEFQSVILGPLSDIMLAQAQEILWLKCISEKRKETIVAKLAAQCGDYYQQAAAACVPRPEFDKSWAAICDAKKMLFEGDAQFRMGLGAQVAEKHGEAVCRFRAANDNTQRALRRAQGTKLNPKGHAENIAKKLAAEEKDNSLIFLELIPELDRLPVIERASLVSADKPLPDYSDEAIIGEDVFKKLVPFAILEAVTHYKEKVTGVIGEQVQKLRAVTQDTINTLNELNLPGTIEALENPAELPKALAEKSQDIATNGGLAWIESKIDNLPGVNKDCLDLLNASRELIAAEERDDDEMRARYGDRWRREKSASLTDKTRGEGDKYAAILAKAAASDQQVIQKFADIRDGIAMLCKPARDLLAALPSQRAGASESNNPAVKELKAALSQLDILRTERDGLEAEFSQQQSKDDITSVLMDGTGSDVQETVFQRNIDKVYGPLFAKSAEIIQRSAAALAATRDANARFAATRSSASSEREKVLNDLMAKYEAWKELRTNLQEGEKFYGNLKALLLKFQNKCKDFCDVRHTEKGEMMKDLTQAIINTPHDRYSAHSSAPPPQYNPPPQGAPAAALQQQQQPQQPPARPPQPPARPPPMQQPQQQQQQPPYAPPSYPYGQQQQYSPYGQQQWGQAPPSPQGYSPQAPYAPYGGYQQPYQPPYQPSPYAPVPVATLAPGEWACARCTFHNNALIPTCEMCGTPRS